MRNDAAELKAYKKQLRQRRKGVTNFITILVMAPLFVMFFLAWKEPTLYWLYDAGILPEYGVMRFFNIRSIIDWDEVMVSAGAGALFGLIGGIIGSAIAKIVIR